MTLRTLALAGAAGLALAASLGSAASAQQVSQVYDRLVVFGDSLSDDGNLPAGAAPPPYFGNRFSNGPVFTELLGFGPFGAVGTTAGSVNYAFGGARTDTAAAAPPGLAAQFATYKAVGGSFGPNNLVIAWGGANDIFQAFQGAAGNPATALTVLGGVAQTAAINQATLTQGIIASGGRTILVGNLPDFSKTPQFSPASIGAAGSSLAGAASTTFNGELLTRLNAVAAANPSANVILFDTNRALTAIAANPAAFGFTNVTQSCFVTSPAPSVCATPSTYLYWDGVHPTAAGHQALAALATDYLTYGQRGAASTLLSEASLTHRQNAMDAISDRLGGRELSAEGAYIQFDGGRTSIDARTYVGATDLDSQIWRIGLEHPVGAGLIGMVANFGKTHADGNGYDFDVDTFGVDVYYGWRGGNAFVNLSAGGGADKYDDVARTTAITPVVHNAFSEGWNLSAKAQAGLWMETGGLTLSPRAAVSAIKVQTDGYSEDGFAARHVVAERSLEAIFGEVSLRAETPLGRLQGFAEVGYRADLSYDADPIRTRLVDNPAAQIAVNAENLDGGAALVDAGVSGPLGEGLSLAVAYRGRFGDAWDSHAARVTVNLAF